jgi:hypothetical protein
MTSSNISSTRAPERVVVEQCNDGPAKDSYLMTMLEKRHPETFERIMAQRLAGPKPVSEPMAHVDLTSFSAASLRRGGMNRQRGRPKKRYGVEAVRISQETTRPVSGVARKRNREANCKWNGSWQEAAAVALKAAKVR